ncbi:adenylyl-sulfate kinase [Thalassobacillus devorans]|uniref:Adenylyl-sulfate kinase n=1 Tax=Thalassobacillus devorans TaxID=279813 RepID=A0ABQ1NHN3_9BACI|nr:adenylyl-sulfate kinase [Thalassobacillus devorans]NIK27107.1 adenylylsulfate kinase [Thalassobacillus devorans]GGC74986.1 adenylyl-sulfate kinase [Thalassobacillus devorans]
MSEDITWNQTHVLKEEREKAYGHKSLVIWLTGLSGAGKSTIANHVERELFNQGIHTYLLDGDNLRHGINNNLEFTPKDRAENIRRISEIGKLFVDAGIVVLVAAISPYRKDRDEARQRFKDNTFIEVFVKCSVEECKKRDPKGLYKRALEGKINNFTGISQDYEEPLAPEVVIDTTEKSISDSVSHLVDFIQKRI